MSPGAPPAAVRPSTSRARQSSLRALRDARHSEAVRDARARSASPRVASPGSPGSPRTRSQTRLSERACNQINQKRSEMPKKEKGRTPRAKEGSAPRPASRDQPSVQKHQKPTPADLVRMQRELQSQIDT